jgi:hypothetical protein
VAPIRVSKTPPPPIAEQPVPRGNDARAQWIAGYWGWDPGRDDFVWVSGVWLVAPADRIWINGRWERDATGWTRIAGVWSPRREARGGRGENPGPATDWRTTGPPLDHPDDIPGPPPYPGAFYVPGHHSPEGDHLVWTPGFWARSQAGWDWVPARWVRRADGWEFREGYWTPDPGETAPRRHVVARPSPLVEPDTPGRSDLPPPLVESEPASPAREPAPRDPIAERESAAASVLPPPVVIVPRPGTYRYGYPYVYPAYPYGPGIYAPSGKLYDPYGVVGASVPPFVQRMLDRILP